MKRLAILCALCSLGLIAWAQQAPAPATPRTPSKPKSSPPKPSPKTYDDFMKTADDVLMQMSQILDLPIRAPLMESLRSKQDIRDYIIRTMHEDSTDAERYADDRTLEAFGLIPKGFPLDSFMINSLTEQVAGLYDPKSKAFFIADWIPAAEQMPVMAHELTHALEDQWFNVDPWIKAALPNIDAEMARQAVSEGSALDAMVDYTMRDAKIDVRSMPDVGQFLQNTTAGTDPTEDKNKMPPYIEDNLMFPYEAGSVFTQQFLKAHSGWGDLKLLFQKPPVSTQQIMHPDLYLKGVVPEAVAMPSWPSLLPANWKFLEENVMGEFFLKEILKQFLGADRAGELSPAWRGDRYAVFEDTNTKNTLLVMRLSFDTEANSARFCGLYSEELELKYKDRSDLFRRPNYFQFQTDNGGVFLRCVGSTSLVVEGGTRDVFDKIDAAIGWSPAPGSSGASSPAPQSLTQLVNPVLPASANALQ
jgi:hypothetical protein